MSPIDIFFMYLALGASVFSIMLGGSHLYWSYASKYWPKIYGTVISSGVKQIHSRGTYTPEILYEYQVYGKTYRSDRRIFGEMSSKNPREVREIVKMYNRGDSIQIRYLRWLPKIAVLETGFKSKSLFIFTIVPGISVFIFSIVALIKDDAFGFPHLFY